MEVRDASKPLWSAMFPCVDWCARHAMAGELLEACFLLARAVAPLQRRYAEVAAQKRFLHREYLARLAVEQQAVMLMDAVQGVCGCGCGCGCGCVAALLCVAVAVAV